MNCKDCKHFRRTADLSQGECWRYPPSPFPMQGPTGAMGVMGVRPPVSNDSSCGEWKGEDSIAVAFKTAKG